MLPDIANGPWAIEEDALRALWSIATPRALAAYTGRPMQGALKASVRGTVAVLPVDGPLFKTPSFLTEIFGFSTYATIRQDSQTAIDNPVVNGIVLNINSPGGEVQGTAELAQAIRDARGQKPIVAYAGDLAASAAYWIASAADKIVIGPSAGLGSIGVRAGFTDTSARDARSGVKSIEFVSSQSPYKGADTESDDGRARIQARVDALADVFIDAVASNRGVPRDKVLSDFGKGDVFIGRAAIKAGLADELGSFESVLASLVAGNATPRLTPRTNVMYTAMTIAAAPMPAPVPHIAAERARGLAITGLSKGHEAAAGQALAEGWSVEQFKAHISSEAAARAILAHMPRRR